MLEHVPAWLGKALKNVRAGHGKLAIATLGAEGMLNKGGFRLTSPAFSDGEELDPSFTADEEDAVAPPLEWTTPPAEALELALIVEDPDAPTPEPFCHWLVWGLRAQQVHLLRAGGVRGFHVGSAVRPGGWQAPVDAETVRHWVDLVKS